MDIEPEVARQQMEDTRASLTEKLGTLEQHVVDTVQGATSAVTDTVENVKDAVHETVENVKDTLNLRLQVRRHPWGMMVGSVALGCLGGYLLYRRGRTRPTTNGWRSQPASPHSPPISMHSNGIVKEPRSAERGPGKMPVPEAAHGPSEPGWLSGATNQFGPEITRLKEMAIGMVLGVVRDMVTQSVSEPMKSELVKVMDSITAKLGGEPTRGPESKEDAGAPREGPPERNASEMRGPLEPTRRYQVADDGGMAHRGDPLR